MHGTTTTRDINMEYERVSDESRRLRRRLLFLSLMRNPPTKLKPQLFRHLAVRLDDSHFQSIFGYTIRHFEAIHDALQLPDPVRTTSKDIIESKTAFLMLLAWLKGSMLRSLEGLFGWSVPRLSRIIRHISSWIHRRWNHLLDVTSPRHHILNPRRLDYYAAAIKRKTRSSSIWGAIDGTVRPLAMPIIGQKFTYNGHKRYHALKWQFITTPDGLIFVNGPFDGNRHDSIMAKETLLVQWAERSARGEDGTQRYLYGDQAYSVSAAIISPFKGNLLDSRQQKCNTVMSKYRVTVKWSIGLISMQWRRFRDKQYQRTGLTPVALDWKTAVIISNAHACLVGNQISIAMGCNPPTLEEFFAGPRVRMRFVLPNPTISDSGINSEEHLDDAEETAVDDEL